MNELLSRPLLWRIYRFKLVYAKIRFIANHFILQIRHKQVDFALSTRQNQLSYIEVLCNLAYLLIGRSMMVRIPPFGT